MSTEQSPSDTSTEWTRATLMRAVLVEFKSEYSGFKDELGGKGQRGIYNNAVVMWFYWVDT